LWRKYSWCLLALFFCLYLASAIRINEISPRNPEYVEIYNPSGEEINLKDWKIKDASTNNPDTLVCGIQNCSLATSAAYFLILGKNTKIEDITSESIKYYYTDDNAIGNGLNDNSDSIEFFNSTFSTNFIYNKSEVGKSWQLFDGEWMLCPPSPGKENFCEKEDIIDEDNQSTTTPNQENINNQSNSEQQEKQAQTLTDKNENETDNENVIENEAKKAQTGKVTSEISNYTKENSKIIKLGSKKEKVYESTAEKMKKYSLLIFPTFILLVIILILIKKLNQKNNCHSAL